MNALVTMCIFEAIRLRLMQLCLLQWSKLFVLLTFLRYFWYLFFFHAKGRQTERFPIT